MSGPHGHTIGVVQIAGLVARRIVVVSEGDSLQAGQRFGLIRFGSRVDVYLPATVKPLVGVGQRALAGETILADLSVSGASRSSCRAEADRGNQAIPSKSSRAPRSGTPRLPFTPPT